jgi:hypothetical protein
MNIPQYAIRPNPTYTPIYKLSRPKHCFEVIDGEFSGLLFTFGKIKVVDGGMIQFKYDILNLPEDVELTSDVEQVVGKILNDIIERGYYEFDTE